MECKIAPPRKGPPAEQRKLMRRHPASRSSHPPRCNDRLHSASKRRPVPEPQSPQRNKSLFRTNGLKELLCMPFQMSVKQVRANGSLCFVHSSLPCSPLAMPKPVSDAIDDQLLEPRIFEISRSGDVLSFETDKVRYPASSPQNHNSPEGGAQAGTTDCGKSTHPWYCDRSVSDEYGPMILILPCPPRNASSFEIFVTISKKN